VRTKLPLIIQDDHNIRNATAPASNKSVATFMGIRRDLRRKKVLLATADGQLSQPTSSIREDISHFAKKKEESQSD
jgi:hypothetical protein